MNAASRLPPLVFGQGADAIHVYQQVDGAFGYTFDRGGHKYGDIGFRTIEDALRAARRARNLAPVPIGEIAYALANSRAPGLIGRKPNPRNGPPDRDDQTDLPSDGDASPYDVDRMPQ